MVPDFVDPTHTCKTEKNIFFIHNNSVSLHVHIYRDSRDPTIKLFL